MPGESIPVRPASSNAHQCLHCNKWFPKRPWLEHHLLSCFAKPHKLTNRPYQPVGHDHLTQANPVIQNQITKDHIQVPDTNHVQTNISPHKPSWRESSGNAIRPTEEKSRGRGRPKLKHPGRNTIRSSCPFCYNSKHKFKSLWHLGRHMRAHHKQTLKESGSVCNPERLAPSSFSKSKCYPLKCILCSPHTTNGTVFKDIQALSDHVEYMHAPKVVLRKSPILTSNNEDKTTDRNAFMEIEKLSRKAEENQYGGNISPLKLSLWRCVRCPADGPDMIFRLYQDLVNHTSAVHKTDTFHSSIEEFELDNIAEDDTMTGTHSASTADTAIRLERTPGRLSRIISALGDRVVTDSDNGCDETPDTISASDGVHPVVDGEVSNKTGVTDGLMTDLEESSDEMLSNQSSMEDIYMESMSDVVQDSELVIDDSSVTVNRNAKVTKRNESEESMMPHDQFDIGDEETWRLKSQTQITALNGNDQTGRSEMNGEIRTHESQMLLETVQEADYVEDGDDELMMGSPPEIQMYELLDEQDLNTRLSSRSNVQDSDEVQPKTNSKSSVPFFETRDELMDIDTTVSVTMTQEDDASETSSHDVDMRRTEEKASLSSQNTEESVTLEMECENDEDYAPVDYQLEMSPDEERIIHAPTAENAVAPVDYHLEMCPDEARTIHEQTAENALVPAENVVVPANQTLMEFHDDESTDSSSSEYQEDKMLCDTQKDTQSTVDDVVPSSAVVMDDDTIMIKIELPTPDPGVNGSMGAIDDPDLNVPQVSEPVKVSTADAKAACSPDVTYHYTVPSVSLEDRLAMIKQLPSGKYKCQICHYHVNRSIMPLVHMRSHTEKYPFHCSSCKFKSSVKSAMLRHLNVTHKIKEPRGAKRRLLDTGSENAIRKTVDGSKMGGKDGEDTLQTSPSRSAKNWCHRERLLLDSITANGAPIETTESVCVVKEEPVEGQEQNVLRERSGDGNDDIITEHGEDDLDAELVICDPQCTTTQDTGREDSEGDTRRKTVVENHAHPTGNNDKTEASDHHQDYDCSFVPGPIAQMHLKECLKDPVFTCPFCRRLIYDDSQAAFDHVLSHMKETPYHCQRCAYRSKTITKMYVHLVNRHYVRRPKLPAWHGGHSVTSGSQNATDAANLGISSISSCAMDNKDCSSMQGKEAQSHQGTISGPGENIAPHGNGVHPNLASEAGRTMLSGHEAILSGHNTTSASSVRELQLARHAINGTGLTNAMESRLPMSTANNTTPVMNHATCEGISTEINCQLKKSVNRVCFIYNPSVDEAGLWQFINMQSPTFVNCKACNEQHDTISIFKHWRTKHEKVNPFICCDCPFTCNRLSEIISHVTSPTHVDNIDKELCQVFHICNLQSHGFHQISNKPSHSAISTHGEIYHCNACDFKTLNLMIMKHHIRISHKTIVGLNQDPVTNRISCSVCMHIWTSDLQAALMHRCDVAERIVQEPNNRQTLYCRFCRYTANSSAAIKVHTSQVHGVNDQRRGMTTTHPAQQQQANMIPITPLPRMTTDTDVAVRAQKHFDISPTIAYYGAPTQQDSGDDFLQASLPKQSVNNKTSAQKSDQPKPWEYELGQEPSSHQLSGHLRTMWNNRSNSFNLRSSRQLPGNRPIAPSHQGAIIPPVLSHQDRTGFYLATSQPTLQPQYLPFSSGMVGRMKTASTTGHTTEHGPGTYLPGTRIPHRDPPPYPNTTTSPREELLPSHSPSIPTSLPVLTRNPSTTVALTPQTLMLSVRGVLPRLPDVGGGLNSGTQELRQLLRRKQPVHVQQTLSPDVGQGSQEVDPVVRPSARSPNGLQGQDQLHGQKQPLLPTFGASHEVGMTNQTRNVSQSTTQAPATLDPNDVSYVKTTAQTLAQQPSNMLYSANIRQPDNIYASIETSPPGGSEISKSSQGHQVPATKSPSETLNTSTAAEVVAEDTNVLSKQMEDDAFLDWVLHSPSADLPMETTEEDLSIIKPGFLDSDDCQEIPPPLIVIDEQSRDSLSHDQAEQSYDQAEQSHDQAEQSHDQAEQSHDQAEQSHNQAEQSHDQAEQSHDQAEQSHNQAEQSHGQAEQSHGQAEKSHGQAEQSYDQAEQSHDHPKQVVVVRESSQGLPADLVMLPKESAPIAARAVSVKSVMHNAGFDRPC